MLIPRYLVSEEYRFKNFAFLCNDYKQKCNFLFFMVLWFPLMLYVHILNTKAFIYRDCFNNYNSAKSADNISTTLDKKESDVHYVT